MSGIDFIADAANPGGMLIGEVQHLAPLRPSGLGREQQQLNYDGAGIFELCGITWATEICLDHSDTVQRLQRSPQLPGDKLVQIQLVPSCGMSIQEASVICAEGGWVFNVDGYNAGRHAVLAQNTPPLHVEPVAVSVPVSDAPLTLDHSSPPVTVPVSSLYASGPGVINLYAERAIAPAQTVPGSTVELVWPASSDWTFVFMLVYAPNGAFSTVLCQIQSKRLNFYSNDYFLPLVMDTLDSTGQLVQIQISLASGTAGYDGAVWCRINVPGFVFEGNAFCFNAHTGGLAPETIW